MKTTNRPEPIGSRRWPLAIGYWPALVIVLFAVALGQWDPERRITNNTTVVDATTAGNARGVAMTGGAIHVVYHEQPSILSSAAYYTRSNDNGLTWSSRFRLSGTGTFLNAMFAAVAVSGNNVHAVWFELDLLSGLSTIRYRRSIDGGANWLATQTLDPSGTLNEVPAITLSGNNVYVVWDDAGTELLYRRSTDGGVNWGSTLSLADTAATGSVAADGNNVLVSYSVGSGTTWDIYLRRSTDGGASFLPAQVIETAGTNADISSVAIRGSNGSIVWYDNGAGSYDVRFRRSTDAGATWQTAVNIGSGSSSQEAPCIVATPTNLLHVAYEDNAAGNHEIIYKRSTNAGVTWADSTRLTTAIRTSQRPSLAVLGNDTVGVVWTDDRDNQDYPDVFFRRGIVTTGSTHDVGVTRIVAPTGTIDSTQSVTPACSVYNYGSFTENYQVRMRIGSYMATQSVTSHAPGTRQYVTFTPATNWPRGNQTVRCSTELAGDGNNGNDRQIGSVFVRVLDAEVVSITAPAGTVDSGTTVNPQANVRNNGNTAVNLDVRFEIAPSYVNTQNVNLAAGASQLVNFTPGWTAGPRGSYGTKCTTRLTGDMNTANDKKTGTVNVLVHDVGVVAIVAPSGAIPPGAVIPRATVRNYGTQREPTDVTFRINSSPSYQATIALPGGLPYVDTTVEFPAWSAVSGDYVARCSTYLAPDQVRANDTASLAFHVQLLDVGVTQINAPVGVIDSTSTVVPRATVRNSGEAAASFDVAFRIFFEGGEVFQSIVTVAGLQPDSSAQVRFDTWPLPHRLGLYVTRCSTRLAGDGNPGNDTFVSGFEVRGGPQWPYGWQEVEPLPTGTVVKDGGWLAMNTGNDLIYACRGNKASDFAAYEPSGDNWTNLSPIPAGAEGRPPKKGCDGISDGENYVYMTKGNNTLGFWRYDIEGNHWDSLPDVPLGAGRRCKKGTDLAYVSGEPHGYIYLLKGYNCEFYRFNVSANIWEPKLADAPAGARPKVDEGSWLCWDESSKLYFLKAKYGELWPYDLGSGSWGSQLQSMPLVGMMGKKKKPKDGGAGAWYQDAVYALKGGNTQEFWKYSVAADSWGEKDTMPSYGTTGKKKRVKSGGDFVAYGNGAFFAFKGNKTLETWRYVMPPYALRPTPYARDGVSSSVERSAYSVMRISPNPLTSGFATLSWGSCVGRQGCPTGRTSQTPAECLVSIHDITGRCVLRQAYCVGRSASSVLLDLRSLSSGIYLVNVESRDFRTTQKLVVDAERKKGL